MAPCGQGGGKGEPGNQPRSPTAFTAGNGSVPWNQGRILSCFAPAGSSVMEPWNSLAIRMGAIYRRGERRQYVAEPTVINAKQSASFEFI